MNKKPARSFDEKLTKEVAAAYVAEAGPLSFCNGARWMFEKDNAEFERLETQFMEAIAHVKASYPTDIFPEDGKSIDCLSARMARLTCDNILAKFEELKNEQ